MQTDATLSANNSQHCCVFLHTLLHVVGSCCAKFDTGQTLRSLTEKDNFFCRCYSGHWWNRCKSGNDLYAFAFFLLLLYEHCLNFCFCCIFSVFQKRETLDTRGLHYGMASAQFCRFVIKIQNHLSFILQLGEHPEFTRPLKTELQNIVNTFLSLENWKKIRKK